MKELLKSIYGNKLEAYKEINPKNLPLYLSKERIFFLTSINKCEFIIVFLNNERFNISELKKQYIKYESVLNKNIVYGFNGIDKYQRQVLISNTIPFISKNQQIYLPFLGSFFYKCVDNIDDKKIMHIMPSTQSVYLFLMYSNDKKYNKNKIASYLNISAMSITRACKELKQLDIINEFKKGRDVYIGLKDDRQTSFNKIYNYLINPIQDQIYVKLKNNNYLRSGEYSLSYRSNLSYIEYKEYATHKNNESLNDIKKYDINLDNDKDIIKVQKWKYNPNLFSNNKDVDPISLIATLKDKDDERLNSSLKQIRMEIDTWQIMRK